MGRIDTAIGALREAVALFEELGTSLYVSWSLAILARALALQGRRPRRLGRRWSARPGAARRRFG